MRNPIVSVLVITYCQERYIKQTVESIAFQKTDFEYEIIIGDDCSKDSTEEICNELLAKYDCIKYIRHKSNLGLIGNFFTLLLEHCNGEYIACCAGDDWWIDELKLQKQYNYLQQNKDVSFVHTGYRKFFESSKTYQDVNLWDSCLLRDSGINMLPCIFFEKWSSFPVMSSAMFRNYNHIVMKHKELLCGNNVPGEAMILFPIFAIEGRFGFIPDVSTAYRIHSDSVSHSQSIQSAIRLKVRYCLQKMIVAKHWKLSITERIKLMIQLLRQYSYAMDEGNGYVFYQNLKQCSLGEKDFLVSIVNTIISFVEKSKLGRKLAIFYLDQLKK